MAICIAMASSDSLTQIPRLFTIISEIFVFNTSSTSLLLPTGLSLLVPSAPSPLAQKSTLEASSSVSQLPSPSSPSLRIRPALPPPRSPPPFLFPSASSSSLPIGPLWTSPINYPIPLPPSSPFPLPPESSPTGWTLFGKQRNSSLYLHVFIHIPKCAGDSLYNALTVLPSMAVFQSHELQKLSNLAWFPSPEHIDRKQPGQSWNSPGCGKFWYGGTHCGFAETNDCIAAGLARIAQVPRGWHGLGTPPLLYVAIIREPMLRILSEFYYWHGELNKPFWHVSIRNASLSQWARSPLNTAHNRMTVALADNLPLRASTTEAECTTLSAERAIRFWSTHYSCGPEAHGRILNLDDSVLEGALANAMKRFTFIGIQEDIGGSLALFARLHGWNLKPAQIAQITRVTHASSRAQHPEPDPELQSDIKKRNRLDMMLYAHLRDAFDTACRQHGISSHT